MSIQPYLGTNVNPTSVDELRYRGLLEEGELLLAMFDGVLLDENNRRVGGLALSDFVVLTDQRLITWARGLFNDTVDAFVWKDVDVAEAGTWDPFHGRVRLAFRLPPVAPRTRRIAVKGSEQASPSSDDRVLINSLDYMPADDVNAMAHMVGWVGDQVLAGLAGDALIAAFTEQFPVPQRSAPMPFFSAPPPMAPPPAPPPEAPARKRWWQLGGRDEAAQPAMPDSPAGLVAAYESQRSGGAPSRPADPARPQMPQMPMQGGQPIMPEQPSMYDVSRSLRLVLEAPRRIVSGLRRATEAVGGASEIASGMQDPRIRRNAIAGMRSAVEQHEQERGPLAPIAPLARAVLAFSEPLESELPQPQGESRRIKVQAAVRNRAAAEPSAPPAAATPLRAQRSAPAASPPADTPAEVRVGAAVRRSIAVRRSEPEAPADESQVAPPPPIDISPPHGANGRVSSIDPAARPAVRRIVISRSEE